MMNHCDDKGYYFLILDFGKISNVSLLKYDAGFVVERALYFIVLRNLATCFFIDVLIIEGCILLNMLCISGDSLFSSKNVIFCVCVSISV